ncbi:ComEA family DNA-binding protein [Chitinophaga rhizosphaerae]|uniref:ComEA family DNA-binding protein n=1 Tax=Chitinophaga rhizosphaerae TaxID=1864947 RepID=UPI000F7FFD56|nr:helix-hairpin-helix domain-containing protein [Chitinophaga rhizosphaerae]
MSLNNRCFPFGISRWEGRIFLLWTFFVYCIFCSAMRGYACQEEPQHVEEWQEQQAGSAPEEMRENDEQWTLLQRYLRRPLNLNTATAEELQELGVLLPEQVFRLLEHRNALGPLIAIYELQAIKGFDMPTIRRLLPYVSAGNAFVEQIPFRNYWTEGKHSLQLRYARTWDGPGRSLFPAAEKPPAYMGSPDKLTLRYRYAMGRHMGWGLVLEKDAGESWLRKSAVPLPDHIGFHWVVRRPGLLKTLVLGDYTINIGQGLVQWHGMAPGKGASVLYFKREGESLRPYAGAGEFYFYRGVASTLALRKSEITAWLSARTLDGRLKPAEADTAETFGSILSAGYHRSISELEARGNIKQYTAGAIWKRRWRAGHVAFNAQGQHFSVPLQRGDEWYRQFLFQGDRLLETSVDHAFNWRNVHFFGEAARSSTGHLAMMQGWLAVLSSAVDAGMVWRTGAPGFVGMYGAPFGASGLAGNERGCYGALQWRVCPALVAAGFVDVFGFPWLRYRVSAPSKGTDALMSLQWNPSRHAMVQGSYRYTEKMQDMQQEGAMEKAPMQQRAHQLQLRCEFPISPVLTWRARTQCQLLGSSGTWIAIQQWNWRSGKWKGNCSYAWYDGGAGLGMYLSGLGFPGDGTVARFSGSGWYLRCQAQRTIGDRWSAWCSWQFARSRAPVQTLAEWRKGALLEGRSTVLLQVQYEWGKQE